MNAHHDTNGAELVPQPVIEPRFPFGCVLIPATLGWALICAVIGWAVL